MKTYLLIILFFGFTSLGFAQKGPSKKLPPMKMLPKAGEVKQIFELPEQSEYSVFDRFGNLVSEGEGQFIDCTKFEKGTYFIRYNGKTEKFEKK